MSEADNRRRQQPHPEQGWQPLPPGGEYESEATAFVQLPEGFTTEAYGAGYRTPGTDPLAAPGHGYTPPASFPAHAPAHPGAGSDPAATGQWTMPFADQSAGYADPAAGYADQTGRQEPAPHQGPPAGYQANAPEGAQPWGGEQVHWPVAGSPEAAGGGWHVPAADDVLEESGEYRVGDDQLTGHGGAAPGADGGYPAPYEGAGSPGQGTTGHWNFSAGLDATGGAGTGADGGAPAGAGEPYPAPADDPYARGAAASGTGGATGHWSLPADALAQWPPAGQPAHQEDAPAGQEGATEVPAPRGAESWSIPVVEGEQSDTTGEFVVDPGRAAAAGAIAAPEGEPHAPAVEHGAEPAAPAEHGAEPASEAPAQTPPADPAPAGPQGAPQAPTVAVPDAVEAGQPEGPAADPVADSGPPAAAPPAVEPAQAPAPAADAPPAGSVAHDAEAATAHPAPPEPAPAAPALDAPTTPDTHDEHPCASYVLRVNGVDRPVTDAWIGESLLYVLRERLGLAGAKDGCSQGECGACSVQVDGRLVASCLVPAATAAGSEVRTVEGLAENGVPSDVQQALAASGAVQCGFCVPGMAMTVHDLLEGNHAPTELETRKALCGNLCRCSGYRGVLDAVADVVASRAEAADQAPAETARIPHQAGPADPMDGAPHHQEQQPGGAG